MSRFNWSAYPGDPPEPPDPHPYSEEACGLLEDAGVDQTIIDKICEFIDELASQANRECPQCERRAAEEYRKSMQEFEATPPAARDGFVMVPKEPDRKIIYAMAERMYEGKVPAVDSIEYALWVEVWKAGLAATPQKKEDGIKQ